MNLISHILNNFKKLRKAKITFLMRDHLARLKETFQKSGTTLYDYMDCWRKTEDNPCILHWRAIPDMWEFWRRGLRLYGGYKSNPVAPDRGNPSFRSSLHLPRINLPTYDGSLDVGSGKVFVIDFSRWLLAISV